MNQGNENKSDSKKILRIKDVLQITGYSRAGLYRELKRGFPKPIKLGKTRCIGWPIEVINEWYQNQLLASQSINASSL
jgi:prophage regulatory protein